MTTEIRTLFIVSLTLMILGFLGLLALPSHLLTVRVVWGLIAASSLGCIGLVTYGVKTQNK